MFLARLSTGDEVHRITAGIAVNAGRVEDAIQILSINLILPVNIVNWESLELVKI